MRSFNEEDDRIVRRVGRSITKTEAARLLGIDRRTLARRMSHLGITLRRWDETKRDVLRSKFKKWTMSQIQSETGMTRDQIRREARRLGLVRRRDYDVTEAQFRAEIKRHGILGVAKRRGKSERAVSLKAWRLGIHPDTTTDALTPSMAAEVLGVTASTVHKWIKEEVLTLTNGRIGSKTLRQFVIDQPMRVNPATLGDSWPTLVFLLAKKW